MPYNDNLDWVTIEDFRPGIYSSRFSGGGVEKTPLGAAQEDGTWGCLANVNGQLIPGPRLVTIYTNTDVIETNHVSGTNRPPGYYIHIGNIASMSAIQSRSNPSSQRDGESDLILVPLQYFYKTGGNYRIKNHPFLIRAYMGTPDAISLGSNFQSENLDALDTGAGFSATSISKMLSVATAGTDPTLNPTYPIMLVNGLAYRNSTVYYELPVTPYIFPTISGGVVGFADTYETNPSSFNLGPGFVHQNRYISLVTRQTLSVGSDGIYASNFDKLYYSETFDVLSPPTGFNSFLWDTTLSGIGSFASMNANELLLIRNEGGGVVIRGALEAPTVINYPGITPTQGAMNYGVNTPLGYVYGSKFGVHAWNGGDSSTLLSPQLEGWFWRPTYSLTTPGDDIDSQKILFRGQFAYSEPFIFAPNNWIYDIRLQSWFRLPSRPTAGAEFGTPDTGEFNYAYYTSSSRYPWLYAALHSLPWTDAESANALVDRYDLQRGRYSYSWHSHPIRYTRQRISNLRAISLVIKATVSSTVIVSWFDVEGREHSERFDVPADDRFQFIRKEVGARVLDFDPTIYAYTGNVSADWSPAFGDDGLTYGPDSNGAPTIDRIMFGFGEEGTRF